MTIILTTSPYKPNSLGPRNAVSNKTPIPEIKVNISPPPVNVTIPLTALDLTVSNSFMFYFNKIKSQTQPRQQRKYVSGCSDWCICKFCHNLVLAGGHIKY